MPRRLYKVIVQTDLLVMADNEEEAVAIGKQYAPDEIIESSQGNAVLVRRLSDISNEWHDLYPFCKDDTEQDPRTCKIIAQLAEREHPPEKKQQKKQKKSVEETTTTTTKAVKEITEAEKQPLPGRRHKKAGRSGLSADQQLRF